MKSVLLVGLFVVLITLSTAAKTPAPASSDSDAPEPASDVVIRERGDKGHSKKDGHGHTVYHQTHGQELFQGEEWMLLVPLVVIPLIICACWYFFGGSKGGDEGWGWDRMGYSDTSVGGQYQSGSYDTRSFVPADTMDKSTHQRIMNGINQQPY